jgi:curved DNA-binding protein CbpA
MVAVDPYQLLGVQRTSSTIEVVLAYEHLAVIFDPVRWTASQSLTREATAWAEAIDEARRTILSER